MEKRLIIAIGFSILIIIAYPVLLAKLYPGYFKSSPPAQTENRPAPRAEVQIQQTQQLADKEVNAKEVITTISTDVYEIDFSNLGGAIKRIVLKNNKHSNHAAQYELVNILNPEDYVCAIDGLAGADLSSAEFKAERFSEGIS